MNKGVQGMGEWLAGIPDKHHAGLIEPRNTQIGHTHIQERGQDVMTQPHRRQSVTALDFSPSTPLLPPARVC